MSPDPGEREELEYTVGRDGGIIAGDIGQVTQALMDGYQLVFRARSDPGPTDPNEEWSHSLHFEAYACRSFFVVPEKGYFAGIIGPKYCAVQNQDLYTALQWHGHPIYDFQTVDSLGNSSVHHFFTHPGWPPRPSQTDRYDPLNWKLTPRYRLALHVDDRGRHVSADIEAIRETVQGGRKSMVLIRNLYDNVHPDGLDCDYWVGAEIDLAYYFPENQSAAGQAINTLSFTPRIPIDAAGASPNCIMAASSGHVAQVTTPGQQAIMVQNAANQECGAEMRIHIAGGMERHQREMRWFVET